MPSSGSITWSGSGHNVNISGNNATLTCYDLSLHGGAQVINTGNNNTISWNNFKYGSNASSSGDGSIMTSVGGSNLTVIYNVFDGGCPANCGTGAQSSLIGCYSNAYSGSATLRYNYFTNFNQHVFEYCSGATTPTITYQYNVITNGAFGTFDTPHLNFEQFGNNGNVVTTTTTFNTVYLPSNPTAGGGEGFQASESSNSTGTVGNGSVYSNNTMIYSPNGAGVMHIVGASSPGNQITANANYIDKQGAGSFWFPCGGSVVGNVCNDINSGHITYTNNINMVNGATIPAQ